MICEICKQDKPDVQLRIDPFDWEVNDVEVERYLCEECEHQRFMDT